MEEGRNGGGTEQARGGVLYNLGEVAKAEAQGRGAINSGVSPIKNYSYSLKKFTEQEAGEAVERAQRLEMNTRLQHEAKENQGGEAPGGGPMAGNHE